MTFVQTLLLTALQLKCLESVPLGP